MCVLYMEQHVKHFIYRPTDGSVSDKAGAAVIDNSSIEHLPDKSSTSSAELHALYFVPDRLDTAVDDEANFIIFCESKSTLQSIWG